MQRARARREATPPLMPVIRRAEDMTRGNALKSVARATALELLAAAAPFAGAHEELTRTSGTTFSVF